MLQNIKTQVQQPLELFGRITIGTTGAVSSYSGIEVSSVTKNSHAGDYTITLKNIYYKLLSFKAIIQSRAANSEVFQVEIDPASSSGVDADLLAKVINIQLYDAAKADVNAASGSVIIWNATVRNSAIAAGE